ncbi:MAG: hypothetical protein IT371_07095 [Deltaproteobacteria bacterium]|nr:hypothetical protein [Deltaproteobacteria bacterium]
MAFSALLSGYELLRERDAMDLDTPIRHGRSGLVVIVLVLLGAGVLGVGGYIAYSKRSAGGGETPAAGEGEDTQRWCDLRREWGKKVNPLTADIGLKSIRPQDKAELEELVKQRNVLCGEYGQKVRDLKVSDARIQAAEVALVKEGKVRANISVEISNLLSHLATEDVAALRTALEAAKVKMVHRLRIGRAASDKEVTEAMSGIRGCDGIYRGPMTDDDTADNPYISWEELEMRRSAAQTRLEARLHELEPVEEYTNKVYHDLMRKYGGFINGCYRRFKKERADLSSTMGLRVRLKKTGEVQSLAIEWMDVRDERLLDCMLQKAASWKLPPPGKGGQAVVVKIDFKGA